MHFEEALGRFVDVEGLEPTNNAAERALPQAVWWRKKSFGTRSASGSRSVERLVSVTATCRWQRRRVLDYLSVAIEARVRGEAAPSLLPESEAVRKAS